MTSGAASTSVGLTATISRGSTAGWQLNAGALVLADGGVCCIDELARLRKDDQTGLLEAMEQQTVSIAKAGVVTKLSTRCSVIGACNPEKGKRYDTSLTVQRNVPSEGSYIFGS